MFGPNRGETISLEGVLTTKQPTFFTKPEPVKKEAHFFRLEELRTPKRSSTTSLLEKRTASSLEVMTGSKSEALLLERQTIAEELRQQARRQNEARKLAEKQTIVEKQEQAKDVRESEKWVPVVKSLVVMQRKIDGEELRTVTEYRTTAISEYRDVERRKNKELVRARRKFEEMLKTSTLTPDEIEKKRVAYAVREREALAGFSTVQNRIMDEADSKIETASVEFERRKSNVQMLTQSRSDMAILVSKGEMEL